MQTPTPQSPPHLEFPPPPAPPPPPPRPIRPPPPGSQAIVSSTQHRNSFNANLSTNTDNNSSQQLFSGGRNVSNSTFTMPVSASLDHVSTFRSVEQQNSNFKGGSPLIAHANHRRVPSASRTTAAILPQPPQLSTQSPNFKQKMFSLPVTQNTGKNLFKIFLFVLGNNNGRNFDISSLARKNICESGNFGTMPKGARIEAFLESIKDSVGDEENFDQDEDLEAGGSSAVSDDSLDAIPLSNSSTSAPATGRAENIFSEPPAPMPIPQQNELIQQLKKRLKKTVSENSTSFSNNNMPPTTSISTFSTSITKVMPQRQMLSAAVSQQLLNNNGKRPEPKPRLGTNNNSLISEDNHTQKTAIIRQVTGTANVWHLKGKFL